MKPSIFTHRLRSLVLAIACVPLAVSIGSKEASGQVTFDFNFTDVGIGFNAPGQTGADRRQGLQNAAGYVSSFFSNYTATLQIDVNGSQMQDETLASAASNFNFTPAANGFGGQGDVMLKILGGDSADPSPGADGIVDWNFEDFQWEPFNDFQAGELDLFSTAVHELLHAVGFSSDVAQNGNSGYGNMPGNASIWSPFDEFITDSAGALIDPSFALDGTRWNAASVGGAGTAGLLFNGPNALAANGGSAVPLFSPTTWLDGSSGSHLDTEFFTGANAQLMNHEGVSSEGLDTRVISPIEIAILRDIGYTNITTQSIPEPSSLLIVLAIAGLAGVGRRRRA